MWPGTFCSLENDYEKKKYLFKTIDNCEVKFFLVVNNIFLFL